MPTSLFILPTRSWITALLEAYGRAPGRLLVQIEPLVDIGAPRRLEDKRLRDQLERACELERDAFQERFYREEPTALERSQKAAGQLIPSLSLLRGALWERRSLGAPPLEVGQAVVDARLPEMLPAYLRWRARWGR